MNGTSRLHRFHASHCFVLLVSLVLIALFAAPSWGQEVTNPSQAAPTAAPAAPSPEKAPSLQVTVTDKLVSLDAVNADVRDVMKMLSDKSGIPIEIFEGVTGKVNLRLEKAPLEKAVDSVLVSVG